MSEVMEDRTINIIFIAKRHGKLDNVKVHIKQYLSDECACPIELYTDPVLLDMVKTAFLDYLRHASINRAVSCVRDYLYVRYDTEIDRLLVALTNVRVQAPDENGKYHFIDTFRNTEFAKWK
jgi:hypothetical protein